MNRIKNVRNVLGLTQDKFAKSLNVSRSAVAMWESDASNPDYTTLCNISLLYNIPADFILGTGVFSKWETILENYDDVWSKLNRIIPDDLFLPTFCEDKYLTAWLDDRLYDERDELQLARWFAFAVQQIEIPEAHQVGSCHDISVTFTPEFEAVISSHKQKTPALPEQDGRDPEDAELDSLLPRLTRDQKRMLVAQLRLLADESK